MNSLTGKHADEPLLKVEHVTINYNGEAIVRDVSFELKQGEIIGIVGESGSGKSTIIKAIMGLLGEEGLVTKGDIWYKGENLTDMSEKKLRRYLGTEIGMVFQDCKAALCPVRKIGVQIHEAVSEHEKITKKETRRRVGEIMKKIGMDDYERVLNSYPFELSGGMQQRVGIAAAMLLNPKILMADEPTSALDVTVQKQVVEEMLMVRETFGTSIVLVTHNMGVIRAMADKVLVLHEGEIMEYGVTEEVFEHPGSVYTKKLLAAVPKLRR